MRKAAGHNRVADVEEAGLAPLVAVAIDDDRNSQHAIKWAADHILTRWQIFYVLHVRRKIPSTQTPIVQQFSISEADNDVASAILEQMDSQTKELILPFQCFCSKRGLQCKEVILDDIDVPKAIVDFITNRVIDKLILGASFRNALIRFHPCAIGYGGDNGSLQRSFGASIRGKIIYHYVSNLLDIMTNKTFHIFEN
ncbi:putative U-box domain-containing protein 53 [Cocos nucifera]|uniref:RING-type E3 ubiquitin transferase n=1 Tax=Cocos nucifera TaxID=13894 RepID=A0A8K0ISP7_COCNU|nr:putative U-box domain-containing protein 53 [Cocos nucifera]